MTVPTATVDLYQVLGVSPEADLRTIREAYRRLARRHHPDAGGDERVMLVLNKAWSVLRDPASRRRYDLKLAGSRLEDDPGPRQPAAPDVRPQAAPVIPSPVGRAFGTVMDFGRYTGWSIGQLAAFDRDYLLWLERTPIGRRLRPEIQASLAPPGEVRVEAARPSRGRGRRT